MQCGSDTYTQVDESIILCKKHRHVTTRKYICIYYINILYIVNALLNRNIVYMQYAFIYCHLVPIMFIRSIITD